MPSVAFSVGDRLVYPNQGLCRVTDIKAEEIAGQSMRFVSLIIIETGARVKVPEDKLLKNGVRAVASREDAAEAFRFLASDSARTSLDWKKRARDNTARLTEGGLIGLAEVVKGLQELSELRPLPPKEREQYNDARHLFVEELATALDCLPSDAEDALDVSLFKVGQERPKRTAEEFKSLLVDDDGLVGLDDEVALLALEEPTEAPVEEVEADTEEPDAGKAVPAAKAPKSVAKSRPSAVTKKPKAVAKRVAPKSRKSKPGVKSKVEAKAKPKDRKKPKR